MSEPVIQLQNISKSFGQKKVLQSLDLQIYPGSILGLIGKNGAGKSTIIKSLLGILKPDEGQARIFGESSWELSAKSKQRIGYVPQVFSGFRWMRVEALLDYVGAFYKNWDKAKVNRLIKEWDLDDWSKVGQLSEGERQKLSIIIAMGHDPDVYIFDEPVAALDPLSRRRFLKQLIELSLDAKKTMLFSSHITSDLERVADDIAILKDGQIWFNGDLGSLKERIRRLRIHSAKPLPDLLPLNNIISASIKQNDAIITVEDFDESQLKTIKDNYLATVTIDPLNLEDIFVELSR